VYRCIWSFKSGARDLPIAFFLLSLLTALFPVLAVRDGLAAQSLFAALAALILATAAVAARAADVQFAARLTRWLGLAAAIPVLLMVIQLLPMPFPGLSHTIWINGNEALDRNAWGHISVDLGKTLGALAFYLANIALILTSILVARNHLHAGRLLIVLGASTILTVVALLVDRMLHVFSFALGNPQEVLGAASALGLVLSLAAAAVGIERRGSPAEKSSRFFLFASGAGILICGAGLATAANANIAIVAAFGAAIFASNQCIRRLKLAAWTTTVLLATLITAAAMIVVWRFDTNRALSPLLQFATAASTGSLAVAQRLLSDTGWLGTGAGTYTVLLPIYRGFENAVTGAPSTAAALTVELGLPMALVAIFAGVGLVITLYNGALTRGRDSFYAAAAASGVVILLGQAFCDASLLQASVAGIGDVLVGIGLAQSVSRADMA
jgi:hypothetical protein